jgi:carbon storage regulator CsrA
MLVLSRKRDQSIILKVPGHKDILVTVTRIDNKNRVRLGIEAEPEILVIRKELESSNSPET